MVLQLSIPTTVHAVNSNTPAGKIEEVIVHKQKKHSLFQRFINKRIKKKLKKYFPHLLTSGAKKAECDVLIQKDGSEVLVKVIEISLTEIKYKKCDNIEGPTYSLAKSDVFMLRYANGTKEVFNEQQGLSDAEINQVVTSELANYGIDNNENADDSGAFLGGFALGFFLSIIGLLFVFAFKKEKRKSVFKGALYGLLLSLSLAVLLGLLLV